MARTECNLLRLGKEVVRAAIEYHLAHHLQRDNLLRNNFRRVKNIKFKTIGKFFVENLEPEFVLWKISAFNRLPQIAPVKIRISTAYLYGFVPQHRTRPQFWPPVEFHKLGLPGLVDQAESVNAESLHHSEGSRYGPVGHHPHDHVHGFGHQRNEIPERIVRRGRLRKSSIRLYLHRVNQIGELHRVLNKKYRNVISNQIKIAFGRIKLDCKTSDVAR